MNEQELNLELYKVFVATITATERRRQQASGIYLSLLSAGAATLGIAKDVDPIFIVLPALTVSLIWYASILNFRRLAEAKFKVISELEAGWNLKPFDLEWRTFKENMRKGVFPKTSLTQLEMIPPLLICIASIGYLLFRASKAICELCG